MSTSTGDSYHHGNLRDALVAAALDALNEGGAAALGLRELARRVGVSSAAPYRHFPDRQALLEAVATEGFRRFTDAMRDAAQAMPPQQQLEALARAYVRFALASPELFRLMFSGAVDHKRDPKLAEASEAAYATLAVTAAREDAEAPAEVAVGAWAFVHGLAMLLIDRQILGVSASGAEALVERLARRLVRGLRASRGQ